MKKLNKILTHFGDPLCRKYIYILLHVVFNLTMEWTHRGRWNLNKKEIAQYYTYHVMNLVSN